MVVEITQQGALVVIKRDKVPNIARLDRNEWIYVRLGRVATLSLVAPLCLITIILFRICLFWGRSRHRHLISYDDVVRSSTERVLIVRACIIRYFFGFNRASTTTFIPKDLYCELISITVGQKGSTISN